MKSFPLILSRPVKLQSRPTGLRGSPPEASARAVVSSELVLFIRCIESTTKICDTTSVCHTTILK